MKEAAVVVVMFVVDYSEYPHLRLSCMRQQRMEAQGVRYANVEIPRMTGGRSGMWGILVARQGLANQTHAEAGKEALMMQEAKSK